MKLVKLQPLIFLLICIVIPFAGSSSADESRKYLDAVREFADNVLQHICRL
jgi:hypothetical protein